MVVSHIFDTTKTYLPYEFQKMTIYEEYKSELLSRVI